MRFGSLFSGIEGIGLGLIWAGMTCAWHVDNNEFCQKVLHKYWPDVPKYGDIRNVGKQNLETVDLIAGGFPCQPFSVAGKRRGTKDDRHLWPEMLRVISELKPTWVLGENVPGIIPIFLDQAVSDLEAEGYTCEAFVLPACAFDAPHRRDRLFIIAYDSQTRARMESGGNSGSGGQRGQSSNTSEPTMVRQEHGEGGSKGIEASNRFGVMAHSRSGGFGKQGNVCEQPRRTKIVGTSEDRIPYKREGGEGGGSILENSRCTHRQGSQEQGESNRETPHSSIQLERPSGTSGFIPDTEGDKGRGILQQRVSSNSSPGSYRGGETYRWLPEPDVGRVAHGVPDRVDRLKSLGNAVVPAVAQHIGEIILQCHLANIQEQG